MKKGTYIGSDQRLQGKTALIVVAGDRFHRDTVPENKVRIQADDISTGLGYGWHEFPAEDWEVQCRVL